MVLFICNCIDEHIGTIKSFKWRMKTVLVTPGRFFNGKYERIEREERSGEPDENILVSRALIEDAHIGTI